MKRFVRTFAAALAIAAILAPGGIQVGGLLVGAPAAYADASNLDPAGCKAAGGTYLSVAISGDKHCVTGDQGNGGVIVAYLTIVINYLAGLVGLAVLLMLLVSGVQYITSRGNPAAITAAKTRLMNAVVGFILFVLMWGILQFLIPDL